MTSRLLTREAPTARRASPRHYGALADAGYHPVEVDLGELLLGGGGVKCCTQEIRPTRPTPPGGTPR